MNILRRILRRLRRPASTQHVNHVWASYRGSEGEDMPYVATMIATEYQLPAPAPEGTLRATYPSHLTLDTRRLSGRLNGRAEPTPAHAHQDTP